MISSTTQNNVRLTCKLASENFPWEPCTGGSYLSYQLLGRQRSGGLRLKVSPGKKS
jgi:hypothetical protein